MVNKIVPKNDTNSIRKIIQCKEEELIITPLNTIKHMIVSQTEMYKINKNWRMNLVLT